MVFQNRPIDKLAAFLKLSGMKSTKIPAADYKDSKSAPQTSSKHQIPPRNVFFNRNPSREANRLVRSSYRPAYKRPLDKTNNRRRHILCRHFLQQHYLLVWFPYANNNLRYPAPIFKNLHPKVLLVSISYTNNSLRYPAPILKICPEKYYRCHSKHQ